MKLIFYKCGQMPFPPKPPSKGEEPGRDGLDLTPPDPNHETRILELDRIGYQCAGCQEAEEEVCAWASFAQEGACVSQPEAAARNARGARER